MHHGFWRRPLIAGLIAAAFLLAPCLPLPGMDRASLGGAASAQPVDIDFFYDQLDPFGQWVWHPRYGYVWLPETVSPYWRPYTVGRWIYTDEYGWYWDSHEPFAWAVYHYGRWGYNPDYGWFWVPGDVWAPAWVQWRYSDNYVGWAPIGPGRQGYAWGTPVSYDPPIAEAWVFVPPRYMTSPAIGRYALPIAALGPAFLGATTIYRPEFRRGVVYNYGMPRDRLVRIIRRPIVVEKVYRFDRRDKWDRSRDLKGVRIYAPGFSRADRPRRPPKRFADHPSQFKPKARLQEVYKGDVPKGWGPSAKTVVPITKEARPDAWKKKDWNFGRDDDRGRDRDKDKGQAAKDQRFDPRDAGGEPGFKPSDRGDAERKGKQQSGDPGPPGTPGFKPEGPGGQKRDKQFGTPTAPTMPEQTGRVDQDDQRDRKRNKGKQQFGDPGQPGGFVDPRQTKQFDQDGGGRRNKNQQQFGDPGGQQGRRADDGGGGDGRSKKQEKCERNPDHPACR